MICVLLKFTFWRNCIKVGVPNRFPQAKVSVCTGTFFGFHQSLKANIGTVPPCVFEVPLWISYIVVQWLALLLCIWEVPGSNVGPETGCCHWGFSWISSVPPVNAGIVPNKLGKTASFHILCSSSFTYYSFIQLRIIWVTEKASLKKLRIYQSYTVV
jgi:hypothetical protein